MNDGLGFLQGGGEAARLVRGRDWSDHPLGPPQGWPVELKTALSLVLNSPESMILAWGPELHFFFNDTYIPLLGPRLNWATGAPFREVWADGWEQARPIIDDAFAGRSRRFDDLPWKLGTDRGPADTWFTFSYSRVLDAEGGVAGLFVFTNETTERVLGDAALRESEERLRLVVEGARDHAIFTTDEGGVVTTWSAGAEAAFGWTAAEMVGQSASALFTPEDRARGADVQELTTAARDGCANDERWHLRRDGGRVFMNGSVHPLPPDAQGRPRGFLKIARDETERWRAGQKAALETERQRRSLQQMPGFAAILSGPDHVFTYVNDAYVELAGVRDFIGRPVREVFPDLAEQGFFDLLDTVYATGEPFTSSRLPVRLDAGERVIDLLYQPIRDDDGAVTGIFAGGYDVTDAHNTAAALADSEARYRALFDSIDEGFCVIEFVDGPHGPLSDYVHVEANPAYERHAGLIGVVGRRVRDLVPDEADGWVERYGAVLRTGESIRFERELVATGRVLELAAFRVDGPERRQVAVLFQDITERKRAEAELRQLNETLESQVAARTQERDRMWRLSRDLFLIVGRDGVAQALNPTWEREFGYVPDTLLGTRFDAFVHADDRELVEARFKELLAGAATVEMECRVRRAEGDHRDTVWTCVAGDGVFYCTGRDITEQRRIEEALRQAQKMEAVGQLTGGLAHDFNNLLAGISGSLEMMQTRIGQGRLAEVERYVGAAQGAARRAAALTHRLLAFSRRQTLDPRPTNVNQLVTGMEELIRRTVGPAVQVEVVGASGLWPTLVDPPQLENALLNLCINARDAMPDGGRITIETANKWLDEHAARTHDLPVGQYVSLCVTDTGTGMTPDVKAKAFDPFFTTKPIGQGTGLGLSMIYGFAQQSGGQVRIYSELGEGTTLCIYLPRHVGEAEDADPMLSFAAAPRAEQGETVLVVDDEPTVRMLITEVLEDLGYAAIEASDSLAGLKVLQSDVRLDLLITDVGLPGGMNGRQMADAGRAVRPALKVLFITGYAENAVLGGGRLEPGMALLTKPFVVEALGARIREMIAPA